MMKFMNILSQHFKPSAFSITSALILSLTAGSSFAQTITIHRNTLIITPTTYNNVTLDMSDGSFIIKTGGALTVKNSVINGTLSKDVPILFTVDNGKLNLDNNKVKIKTLGLPQDPFKQSLQHVMNITLGSLDINANKFSIDKEFSAGFLVTTASIPTTGLKITNNRFKGFHGVLYLISSDKSLVSGNTFLRNSYGQIVIIGNDSKVINNRIYFAGNDHLGNAMDIINSNNITINNNILFTPTCHGIYVLNSSNLFIDNNTITGGLTYAMNIYTSPETVTEIDDYVAKIASGLKFKNLQTNNIRITHNYMTQNRYGIAISDADHIFIKGNYFLQRFEDAATRKFWTNNDVLFINVTNVTWVKNWYKEAFTQTMDNAENGISEKFVVFPKSGGVVL
jgi:parallel beta-helix repeat protein